LSSPLGLPIWQDLRALGLVAGVAVPDTGQPEVEELVAQLHHLQQPTTRLRKPTLAADLQEWLAATTPQAVLVLTFPWRIPAALLAVPPQGFLNFHFAALPGYRGPEPLFWQLRHGEANGAVSVHQMAADFDTGPLLLTIPVPIGPTDTHGLHRARLAAAGVGAVRQVVAALEAAHATGQPLPLTAQDPQKARYWPRPTLADLCLRWAEPAISLDRLVRAANPWNRGALATLRGQPLRVLVTTVVAPAGATTAPPGTVVRADDAVGLIVACGDGSLLRLDAAMLTEGYFVGPQLVDMGIAVGELLGELLPQLATVA
jgi:methionyl-tRNA formyltransferase